MAYNEFTLERVEAELGVTFKTTELFSNLEPVIVPAWLKDYLELAKTSALVTEKARSEFIVAPILLAVRELANQSFTIHSGHRMDVDPERRLVGECDFILSHSESLPLLRAPIMTIVEAKKNDVELGLGQCIAQMVAAKIFNERRGLILPSIYGCVTTGELWQFLRLDDKTILFHPRHLYYDMLEMIVAIFLSMVPLQKSKI